jgi:hypothetical protein
MIAQLADARGFVLSYSFDGGASWTAPAAVSLPAGASDPIVAFRAHGVTIGRLTRLGGAVTMPSSGEAAPARAAGLGC